VAVKMVLEPKKISIQTSKFKLEDKENSQKKKEVLFSISIMILILMTGLNGKIVLKIMNILKKKTSYSVKSWFTVNKLHV
jgi:uncharacterized membrane protein SpoIIM required for sporulation